MGIVISREDFDLLKEHAYNCQRSAEECMNRLQEQGKDVWDAEFSLAFSASTHVGMIIFWLEQAEKDIKSKE